MKFENRQYIFEKLTDWEERFPVEAHVIGGQKDHKVMVRKMVYKIPFEIKE